MLKQDFVDSQGRPVPNPLTFAWSELVENEDIDLAHVIAALLMVVAKADEEGKNALDGILYQISCFLQLDGSFWFYSDDYKDINAANVEFAEFLRRSKRHEERSLRPKS